MGSTMLGFFVLRGFAVVCGRNKVLGEKIGKSLVISEKGKMLITCAKCQVSVLSDTVCFDKRAMEL
jgi:hypothetical protein